MIFFCNFALIMRQRFFQPVISLLFAALLMTGCGGKGSVKPLSITLDSIVIDTTATLEKGDVCKVHLKLHLFKGPHAAALNDSLLRMRLKTAACSSTSRRTKAGRAVRGLSGS